MAGNFEILSYNKIIINNLYLLEVDDEIHIL